MGTRGGSARAHSGGRHRVSAARASPERELLVQHLLVPADKLQLLVEIQRRVALGTIFKAPQEHGPTVILNALRHGYRTNAIGVATTQAARSG